MKNNLIIIGSIVLLGVSVYLITTLTPYFFATISPRTDLEQSRSAPEFTLENTTGVATTLSSLRGNTIILNFWTSWNPISVEQLKLLNDYALRYAGKNLKIISINSQEEPLVAQQTLAQFNIAIPTLLDTEGAVGELYDIGTVPLTIFIDKFGLQRRTVTGPLSLTILDAYLSDLGR